MIAKILKPLLLLTVISLITGCKKDDDNPMPAWPMIKTRIIDGESTDFKYGNMWKIVSAGDYYYNYSSNTITANFEEFVLNDQGLTILYKPDGFPEYEFAYDINGYRIDGSGIQYSYNADSNLVSTHHSFGSNIQYSQYTYLPQTNTIGNSNFGKYFLGRSSKNLVSEQLDYRIDSQGDTILSKQYLYHYTFDNNGRVESKREIWVKLPAGDTTENTLSQYTYY